MQLDTAKITQDARTLGAKDADSSTHLVCLLDRGFDIARLPYGAMLKQRLKAARHKLAADSPFHTQLPNAQGTRLSLLVADPGQSAFERLTLARKTIAAQRQPAPEILTLACFGLKAGDAERTCEALLAAALAADFPLPRYKSEPDKSPRLRTISIYGHVAKDGYARTFASARGNNLARWLTALPPNELTPGNYRKRVQTLAREYGWRSEFLGLKKLHAKGAGAFLAVAQGSPDPDAGILHLRYTPKPQSRHPGRAALGSIPSPKKKSAKDALALVGKGICFDTGGTNLKNAKYMHGMHEDMQGSAVALGTLLALTELKAQFSRGLLAGTRPEPHRTQSLQTKRHRQSRQRQDHRGDAHRCRRPHGARRHALSRLASQTEAAYRLRHPHRRLHRRIKHAPERRTDESPHAGADAHPCR